MEESSGKMDATGPQPFGPPAAFNMRLCTLSNMRSILGAKNPAKFQTPAIVRISQHVCSDVNKTLELLRLIVQPSINKEIDQVINKYVEKYFVPAVRNIRINYGEHVVDERHVNQVCCQMLDSAKKMYPSGRLSGELASPKSLSTSTPTDSQPQLQPQSTPSQPADVQMVDNSNKSAAEGTSATPYADVQYNRSQTTSDSPCSSSSTPNNLKLSDVPFSEIENWNPGRVDQNTLFITGHSANKCLGLLKQKCKIYSRFPTLFRYVGDNQDRQWLVENKFQPGKSPARVFISILTDIKGAAANDANLAESSRIAANLDGCGFQLPNVILMKLKYHMKEVYEELLKRRSDTDSFKSDQFGSL